MNIINTLFRFLSGKPGSLRFGTIAHSQDLSYQTIADGNRNMREDLSRLGADWKKTVKSASRYGKED